jgi:uncharacterized membrane protein (DUF4010 family)
MSSGFDILGLFIATLGGAAVGLERQWSGQTHVRFAGLRTFTMLGGIGGLAGLMWTHGLGLPAIVLLSGATAIVAISYLASSRTDIDSTTEIAALVVIAAGVMATTGAHRIAAGVVTVTVLLLIEKSRLHTFASRLDDTGLRAAAMFAAMALVILPLLPEGPYGPFGGIRPRELWILVLFFSGLSFVGYIARRVVPPGRGYLVTGALGGMISSTNVTFTFARLSKEEPSVARELGFGAIAANAVLFPRVIAAILVLNASLALPVARYLAAPFAIALLVALLGIRSSPKRDGEQEPPANPLQLRAALQMAVLFQIVLMVVHAARSYWGDLGVLASAAVLGFTDVDALTMTMARGGAVKGDLEIAALAISIGVLSNTALKMMIALLLGRSTFRLIATGTLAAMLAAGAGATVLLMN